MSNTVRAKLASRKLLLLQAIPPSQSTGQSYKPHFHSEPAQAVPTPPLTPLPAALLISALGTGVCQNTFQMERVLLRGKTKEGRQESHNPRGSVSIQVPREAQSRDSKQAAPCSC